MSWLESIVDPASSSWSHNARRRLVWLSTVDSGSKVKRMILSRIDKREVALACTKLVSSASQA